MSSDLECAATELTQALDRIRPLAQEVFTGGYILLGRNQGRTAWNIVVYPEDSGLDEETEEAVAELVRGIFYSLGVTCQREPDLELSGLFRGITLALADLVTDVPEEEAGGPDET